MAIVGTSASKQRRRAFARERSVLESVREIESGARERIVTEAKSPNVILSCVH
jgi:hypothetical protein